MRKCEDCKYCRKDEATAVSECCRYAPRAGIKREGCVLGYYFGTTLWPAVDSDDWCGEYESKKPTYPTLEALDLKPLTEEILRRRGKINSVEKLLCCTPKFIKSLRGIGSCAYRQILESLERFGLYINGTDEEVQMILKEAAEAEAKADAAVKEALGINQ